MNLAPGVAAVPDDYWALDASTLVRRLSSTTSGLTAEEAARRLRVFGPNQQNEARPQSRTRLAAAQIKSPLLLILIFAAAASLATGEWIDAAIVLGIVGATVGITVSREYRASSAVDALRARVQARATVLRDGRAVTSGAVEVVPGDVVQLSAGSLIPGDGVVVSASDFFVSEAVLTGESFPVHKQAGSVLSHAPIRERTNTVFAGTNVRSGTALCLMVRTGSRTEFGKMAARLAATAPDTEFERGLRHFGYLLTSAMLALVLLVFVAHMLRARPPIETLLFSVALAVGLSPELLPAILTVNLARAARLMAERGVIVRRLNAVENLGSMDVLCTDKTGTLTEGIVQLAGAYDSWGAPSSDVLSLAAVNAELETGLNNPLDDAIARAHRPDVATVRKLAEIPFDFVRKRVSVILDDGTGVRLITKGAFDRVIEACSRTVDGRNLDPQVQRRLQQQYDTWAGQGKRVLAVAVRDIERRPTYARDDERDLAFAGFLTFHDRPKAEVPETLRHLAALGVATKIITGDSKLVALHVAALVGLRPDRVLTGGDLLDMNDEALWHAAERTDLFAEVDPNQKERIIRALRKTGHVVGFLGDGVNDAPAMHAADVSVSVDQAVDVARAAADFILLERNLDVIRRGIEEGRRTFANTLKYILTTTSANLGNMISMAAASLFLPFLPLLAGQILLNNFLSDIPAVGIADDNVDAEAVERPERWQMSTIGGFMIVFGLLSSLFDILTFALLLGAFHAGPALFRTGWFVESLLTELVIALVVRTRRPFFRSRPGAVLLTTTVAVAAFAFALPFLPYTGWLGFVTVPASLLVALAVIAGLYVLAAELAKRRFFAPADPPAPRRPRV
jgi:Mg2+-importing ATPase